MNIPSTLLDNTVIVWLMGVYSYDDKSVDPVMLPIIVTSSVIAPIVYTLLYIF